MCKSSKYMKNLISSLNNMGQFFIAFERMLIKSEEYGNTGLLL